MAISRGQLVKELEPGLNALFGLEYKRYENQHAEIYATESSDRAFEEEVMLSGFAQAQVKPEGSGVTFDNAQETYTARYSHETVAQKERSFSLLLLQFLNLFHQSSLQFELASLLMKFRLSLLELIKC